MQKTLILIAIVLICFGCSSMPTSIINQKTDYRKLIVRDINWKETATSDIPDDQMKTFVSSQPMLNEIFRSQFDKYIKQRGVFEAIAYGNTPPDAGTLVMVPKIYTLKPLGFMPGASFTGLLLSPDGKLLGTYSEERRLSGRTSDPDKMQGNIEDLIKDLAEDAASKLPYTR